MKYRKIFVFMLMIVVMTTVYGQERYRAKPASSQLSIYSLPPLERAISCIKFYEGWHGEKDTGLMLDGDIRFFPERGLLTTSQKFREIPF